jgi:2-polyprenyl-3-methyl-5-hydroxy-6-metoxy-1,4-benzoquinol methylase
MTAGGRQPQSIARLADYRTHYQADAEAIVDPDELDPGRRASEQRRLEALVRLLAPGPGERVLDVGCGSGWLAARCRTGGAGVWALDLARTGVAAARRRFPGAARYQVGDVYHLPFKAGVFDAVVLSEVLEHLETPDTGLAEVKRVLRPGGRMLVSVPYRERIVQHLCIHCNRLTPANAHLHSFDEQRLSACLQAHGLAVRQTLLLTNKLLERVGFPRWSRRWPHGCWRSADRLFNRLVPKPAFLCILAASPG